MQTKNYVIILLVVVVLGFFLYSGMNKEVAMEQDTMMVKDGVVDDGSMMKDEDKMVKDDEVMAPKDDVMVKEDAMMVKSGSYEAYTAEKVAMKASTGNVVLFFRASWCPTCRALDADIKTNIKDIPESLTILDVDYDNSTLLKQKYGVTYQHTLVEVDKDGNMIKKWSGSPTLAAIVSQLK